MEPIIVGSKLKTKIENGADYKITMNKKLLNNKKNFDKKQPIIIQLSDKKQLIFIPKRLKEGKKDGDFSWVGQSKDKKSKAVLSVRNGIMVGTITCDGETYKIYPKDGNFKVIKVDKTKVINFGNDFLPEPKRVMKTDEESAQQSEASSEEPQESDDTTEASEANIDDTIIDILIYYTAPLLEEYGEETESHIQNNFDLARDAYIDSLTEVNLNLIDIKLVPADSILNDDADLHKLLDNITSDGLVRYERKLYSADAVAIFSKYPNGDFCGLAWTPDETTSTHINSFSAIHLKLPEPNLYYCSDLTFAHELGHNFGCYHDRDHTTGTPMYTYAYGYDVPDGGTDSYGNPTYYFATIMSYDSPAINFFSNPNINDIDSAIPIGTEETDAGEDNARTIRENKLKLADNSEQISEVLESGDGDSAVDYYISGYLNNAEDRDGYVMWLEGVTVFDKSNSFYVNIYNETTHELLHSFWEDTTVTLERARYRVIANFSSDETGEYYNGPTNNYTVDISTEYIPSPFNPSIINYLLN